MLHILTDPTSKKACIQLRVFCASTQVQVHKEHVMDNSNFSILHNEISLKCTLNLQFDLTIFVLGNSTL